MAKNKKQDIGAMGVEDLKNKLADDTLAIKKLKYNHAITPIENPLTIRMVRKEIAKVNTALRAKELGIN
jgi:large subunit ribosomal protein L29